MAAPAVIERPSEKETRYDRGVRLWGASGQTALEEAHVCLLGVTGAGCETLKNLVLPGVGKITVVDSEEVAVEDLAWNFFVTSADVGRPRAEVTAALLREMNQQHVAAEAIHADPLRLLTERPNFFEEARVDCVVTGSLREDVLVKLSEICTEKGVHVVALASNFMIGVIRLQAAAEHCVVEGFPDSHIDDMRVTNPFPSLAKYFDGFDLDLITDSHEHSHIPWPVLAHKATKKWQEANNLTTAPLEYKQRKEVKAMLLGMRMTRAAAGLSKEGDAEGIGAQPIEEENFTEASNSINTYLPQPLPGTLKQLFTDAEAAPPGAGRDVFWVLLRALRDFYEAHGVLPVTGVLPDMTSTTTNYTTLRDVHAAEARANAAWVGKRALELAAAGGMDAAGITDEVVASFCRNARHLRVVRNPRITDERGLSPEYTLFPAPLAAVPCERWWYALHLASEKYNVQHGRHPGACPDDQLAEDLDTFTSFFHAWLRSARCPNPEAITAEYIREWVRGGGVETATVASVLGGIAAQEVIKLLTKQRVPIDHTLVYNGITGGMAVVGAGA